MTADFPFKKICVTGGAGFIGSHLVEKLIANDIEVVVFDNLSAGRLENLRTCLGSSNFTFVQGDLLNPEETCGAITDCDAIIHLAANPEVRVGTENPEEHFQQNIVATFNLLQAIRKVGDACNIAFASSSTVYGDARKIPTSEDYGPLKPISIYGASKLAAEALISSYTHTYGNRAVFFRLANVVGARSYHGIIHDFIAKLAKSRTLEILGDGNQTKSYLDVEDCADAILAGIVNNQDRVEIYNIGSEDQVTAKEIADIVCEEMGKKHVKYAFTGGVDGGRGWKGDVKVMLLNIEGIKATGWKPKLNSRQSVRKAAKALLSEAKSKTQLE